MFYNQDFKGQSGYILLGLILILLGFSFFYGSNEKQYLFFEYENRWAHFKNAPIWVSYLAFIAGISSLYSGLRIAIKRCRQRIIELSVTPVTAVLQFIFSLVLYAFFLWVFYILNPFLVTLRNIL